MEGMTPEQVQQLISLLTQNERQGQIEGQTGVSNSILQGPHHSFLGGLLGGASAGMGQYMQGKSRDKRAAMNEQLLRAMQGLGPAPLSDAGELHLQPGEYPKYKPGYMAS